MSDVGYQWWTVQRGTFCFAVRLDEPPRCIPGPEVWWTPQHTFFCGLVSGSPRPIGVLDTAHLFNLPAGKLGNDSWVIAPGSSEEEGSSWALVCDAPPINLSDAAEAEEIPWLPTAMAREQVSGALVDGEKEYFVIDPNELLKIKITTSSFVVSDERISRRTLRMVYEPDTIDITPDLLATRVDNGWIALRSNVVQRIVETEHISVLPGAEQVVSGLSAITGRVNLILDPGKMLDNPPITPPCWIAQVKTAGVRWGIASNNEWQLLSEHDIQHISDHTPVPGPEGMVVQRLLYGEDKVHVLSLEKLAELAGGSLEASDE